MQRWRGLDATPAGWGRCVVTIGVFDGVHRGHQVIIGRAVELARTANRPSLLLTFDPHPLEILRPGTHPAVLTPTRTKAEIVAGLGIDAMCVLPFTPVFAKLTPAEFAHSVLVEALHTAHVVVGENFRFGHRVAGDIATLTELGGRFGFAVEAVAIQRDADTTLSSTYVRSCVEAGDVEAAASALGRPHRLEGVVVRGDQRGRTLGYPTANLDPVRHSAIPADGVYAGRLARTDGSTLGAAISIGSNPTFEGRERRVEAYALDAPDHLDLYGEQVALEFLVRLRPTERFDDVDALLAQMARDVDRTRAVLAGAQSDL